MTTANQSLAGRICLVTGATGGIGLVTARVLAGRGATVVGVGRNRARSEAAASQIRQQTGNSHVEYLLADLSAQADVRRLADDFKRRYDRLHVLVNNAGALFMSRQLSADGIEMTFALNHLGYFLLTMLLLDLLKASAPAGAQPPVGSPVERAAVHNADSVGSARIVNVSSRQHQIARMNFDDLQGTRRFSGQSAYGQSKLANVLFTYELALRLAGAQPPVGSPVERAAVHNAGSPVPAGAGVTVNALHPGFVATNFAANNGPFFRLIRPVLDLFAISAEKGALTNIYLAASPDVEGVTGKYFESCKEVRSSPASYDEAAARRLWEISEQMTGLQ